MLRLVWIAALFLGALSPPADAAETDLLARVDAYRLPRKGVMAMVEVVEVAAAEGSRGAGHAYRVFLNDASDSVVEMLSAAERGRRVLITDEAVWLHIPSSARPVRITPLQRLLGQANYGDVGRLTWAGTYRISSTEAVANLVRPPIEAAARAVQARFRVLKDHPLQLLRLEAVSPTATYPRIDVWISRADNAPLRADYFLTSGKRLKTGWFTEPERTSLGAIVRSVIFHDEHDPAQVTVMNTGEVAENVRPHSFFTIRGFTARIER